MGFAIKQTAIKPLKYFLGVIFVLMLMGCGSDSSSKSNSTSNKESFQKYTYQIPALRNDGWQVSHVDEFSIDATKLEALIHKIAQERDGYRHIDSVTIIKSNKIILDEMFRDKLDLADDWANNRDINLHILNSVTKSFTSALIGIAIDQGYIDGVDVKVHDYFAHKLPVSNWSDEKATITIENWLTMQHGYNWDEWNISYLDNNNLNSRMNNSSDPINFLLSRPMETAPGTTFAYSTGVSFGLGRLLEHATGQSVTSFMEQNLFSPLGVTDYTFWALDNQLHTGSALYLSQRDMAKFGQLFLNKGQWNDEQVISESWVEQSTQRNYDNGNWGYGYQWWSTSFSGQGQQINSFYGDGFGGQYIFVLPKLDAVVVFTGNGYQDGDMDEYRVWSIMENDVVPALF